MWRPMYHGDDDIVPTIRTTLEMLERKRRRRILLLAMNCAQCCADLCRAAPIKQIVFNG